MNRLEHLLGREGLDRLVAAAGGTRVEIPTQVGKPANGGRDGSVRLQRLFGEDLAILLIFHFGGSRIYIPKRGPSTRIDPKRIKHLIRLKLSNREIARRLGCSERAIEKRRAKDNPNGMKNGRKEGRT